MAAKLRGRRQLEGAEHRDADGFRVRCLLIKEMVGQYPLHTQASLLKYEIFYIGLLAAV